LSSDEVLLELASDITGLHQNNIKDRQEQFSKNEISDTVKKISTPAMAKGMQTMIPHKL